jgi:hypothetical protein
MEHLSLEALSRIVDEAPTTEERLHLGTCTACAAELKALQEQTESLAALPELRPPRGDWEVLQARLVSEGLVRGPSPLAKLAFTPRWMRTAAAILIFASGTGVGAAAARVGAFGGGIGFKPTASTTEEAAEQLRVEESDYMQALLQYRQIAEAEGLVQPAGDPVTRMAALQDLVDAGQRAVRQVPTDPFVNGMLASTLAERQAVMRTVSSKRGGNWF